MSKTFKSAKNAERSIQIEPLGGTVNMTIYKGPSRPNSYIGISVPSTDAPAIALAILEAAGHRPAAYDPERLSGDGLLAYIAHKLAVHVGDEVKRAKEAADREALEVEALHLCWIMWDNPDQAWTPMSPEAKAKWLKMARAARELHGATR